MIARRNTGPNHRAGALVLTANERAQIGEDIGAREASRSNGTKKHRLRH